MIPKNCKIIPWKELPTKAKAEFPHLSGMGSDFFKYDKEWYCVDYLDASDVRGEYQNHTMKGTTMKCKVADNTVLVLNEYSVHYVQNIGRLLAIH